MDAFNPSSDRAVCYVADENFLFPTIGSAFSFRSFVSEGSADVIIFYLAEPGPNFAVLRDRLAAMGIKIVSLSGETFGSIDLSEWNSTHISVATLGRFLIADTIAAAYHKMLYIDGDTLFVEDPTKLLDLDPGEGKIAAVDDIRSFSRHDLGQYGTSTRNYFGALGIKAEQGYFNGGMFLVEAKTWEIMARDAFSYFKENVSICKFHDQSAMNSVLGRHRLNLPIAWNFQTPYNFLRLENKIQPKILHFTEANKPWLGPLLPWAKHFEYYKSVEARVGSLVPRPTMAGEEIDAQNKRTKGLFAKMHLLFAPRVAVKKRKIMRYEHDALNRFEEYNRA